jgi:protein-disulfide isomerase
MEENNIVAEPQIKNNDSKQIAGAIVLAGLLIAGAVLLKGSGSPVATNPNTPTVPKNITLKPVGADDRTLGNPNAKVTVIMYEDFQCPFCGAISGLDMNSPVIQSLKQRDPSWTPTFPGIQKDFIDKGSVQFVYRDFPFLGAESFQAAAAARCAGDQGKFWEYHDYLYGHQNGENEGSFSDPKLKSFSMTLGLNTKDFNTCLDGGKYTQAVLESKSEASAAGITGTPKGFILKNGKIVSTIEGAESWSIVQPKINAALK